MRDRNEAPATDLVVKRLLRNEDAFLKQAGPRELTQAVLYFRALASRATTPQARDFYLDRAHQFALRAINGGIQGEGARKQALARC